MSIGGEAVNASVYKTDIRGLNSRPVLHKTVRFADPERPFDTQETTVFRPVCKTHLESLLLRVVPSRFASVGGPNIRRANAFGRN
jgi:hypothetical protein